MTEGGLPWEPVILTRACIHTDTHAPALTHTNAHAHAHAHTHTHTHPGGAGPLETAG